MRIFYKGEEEQAFSVLEKGLKRLPDDARYQYVYAVALAGTDTPAAIRVLEASLKRHSGDVDTLTTLWPATTRSWDTPCRPTFTASAPNGCSGLRRNLDTKACYNHTIILEDIYDFQADNT